MALAIQVIDSQVFRDTLVTIPEVTALFEWTQVPGQYKIFWEHVDDPFPLPYISLNHMIGGRLEGTEISNQYSDTIWRVVAHTANNKQAIAMANAISKLNKMAPVCTAFPGMCGITTIHEKMPIFDRYQVQNAPLFMVGGMYRLRLNLGDN